MYTVYIWFWPTLETPYQKLQIKLYTQGVMPPQAWSKETETELSDSEALTLPGRFEPATQRVLPDHGPLGFQGSYP